MILRRAQPSESREVSEWIAARHYLGCSPAGYAVALEFIEGRERVGAMLLGRPSSRELDADRVLELTRMYFVDETERFAESRGLAQMRRWTRVWLPQIRLLLAYSDPSVGHEGTVYEADGWAPFGRTSKHHAWTNRPNRRGGGKHHARRCAG